MKIELIKEIMENLTNIQDFEDLSEQYTKLSKDEIQSIVWGETVDVGYDVDYTIDKIAKENYIIGFCHGLTLLKRII